MNPSPASHVAQALSAFNAGDLVAAEWLSRMALGSGGEQPQLLQILALSIHEQGRAADALPSYMRLTELEPGAHGHWGNLGNALRDLDRHEEAEQAYLRAIDLAPREAQHKVNLGFLLGDMGEVAGARMAMLDAFELDPGLLDARIYGSLACFECGDARNADLLIEDHAQWAGELTLEQLLDLARALLHLGHDEQSEAVFALARRKHPDALLVRIRRALMLERVNRLDDARAEIASLPAAESVADRELAREIINAHAAIAARDEDPARARALLEHLLATADSAPQMMSNLWFALAKVCDKLGDAEATMAALRHAHDAQLRSARTLVPEMLEPGAEPLKTTQVRVEPEQFARWPRGDGPGESQSPVFIMGFPRSGTTLLEQMLDAHPHFQSMDERAFLQGVIERMERMGLRHPQQLGDLSPAQLDELRGAYWRMVDTTVRVAPGQRLVDKNPLNMLRLPLVCRLFPQAPIVLALRHPCDVLLSCYMQSFRSPSFMVLCSTLERLARSYVNAMKFWIHHEALLGPRVFHLRYEDLLDDVEGHVARLGDFLGIDDARRLLDFQEHARGKGYISTPSYAQVIEPINKKAVGRWKRYEPYFAGALPILRPIMEHWGYDA